MTLAGGDQLTQGTYGLFFVSLVLLAVAQFAGNDGLGKVGGGSVSLRGLLPGIRRRLRWLTGRRFFRGGRLVGA